VLKQGQNPDPLVEIEFWKNKKENLNSIFNQLQSERIKRVLKFLEQNKSTYKGPFSKLQKEVQAAMVEANDNSKYLDFLKELFTDLTDESADFITLPELFPPIMHVILLIWNYSEHYNTPARLVVLIREICNAIITQACRFIDGKMIFNMIQQQETQDAYAKLSITQDVCSKFKEAYFEYKSRANNTWKITTSAVFVRLDSFSERCQDIMHLTRTIVQFGKLEKVEIGGTKGKTLSAAVEQIFKEFEQIVEEFQQVDYDIMDISARKFDEDFYNFRCRIKELERRLGAILTQSFDDCDTINGKFKLLESFEGLLDRPIIQDELEKKHVALLELFKQDLKVVQAIFLEGKTLIEKKDSRAPISKNLPPVSGALNWTNGLRERIQDPFETLSNLSAALQDREEYKDVEKLYNSLLKSLSECEKARTKDWERQVETQSKDKLLLPLLKRNENGTIKVNFDPELVSLLREVKYLLLLNLEVPESAREIYDRVEIYRKYTCNLDLIVAMYNNILTTLLPVEEPLLEEKIEKMNRTLTPGFEELNWLSPKVDNFISQSMFVVKEVDGLVKKMKSNVLKMKTHMKLWTKKPFLERKNKPMSPEDFDQQHKAVMDGRKAEIKEQAKDIHKLLKDTGDYLKIKNKASNEWRAYENYVSAIVIEGIEEAIIFSLNYLSDQISPLAKKHESVTPMFDVKVILSSKEVQYDPPICETPDKSGVRDIINGFANDFLEISTMVTRLDTKTGDYLKETRDSFEICGCFSEISRYLDCIEEDTNKFIAKYLDYNFLWVENLEETFEKFLKKDYGEQDNKTEEEKEEERDNLLFLQHTILKEVAIKMPPLELFHEEISKFKTIQARIQEVKVKGGGEDNDIGWLRVNSQPLKAALDMIVTKWINKYSEFLHSYVNTILQNMAEFLHVVENGIKKIPEGSESEKDKSLLMKVMTHLRDMKMVKEGAVNLVEPMRETVMILKKNNIPLERDLLGMIEQARTRIEETNEKALEVKEVILPLQTQETKNIKKDLDAFTIEVKLFRSEFIAERPCLKDTSSPAIVENSYNAISTFYKKLVEIENKAKEYNNLETLFELQKSGYKEIKDCRNELKALKYMWDMISFVDTQFEAWKTTLWDQIDTDALLLKIKEIQQKITSPTNPKNKEIKSWKAFISLNERVRNMNTILPLISQLHSKFMEKRHWKSLMKITGKEIKFQEPNFCLEDLIKLQLHKYAEEVQEIVDLAQKEAKIESNLNTIEAFWTNEEFGFNEYKEAKLLSPLDDMIDILELHSMELMGMITQRYVEFFKERVIKWQKALRNVENVIEIWMKVQKNWQRLETIFLCTEDIRAQLPEDTKRFEQLDNDFRDLMKNAAETPGVVEACNTDNREEFLNTLFDNIEQCEKSLNEYLDKKKMAFPRFYFVSNQALLDILSNANNPKKIEEHLSACFDGIKRLVFVPEEGNKIQKRAEAMVSKEGERVQFSSVFTAEGPVEVWLNGLEKMMRVTLRDFLEQAKSTADNWEFDTARHIWLNDYCAQIALVTTQIIWTEEVSRAFEELDGGADNVMKEYLKTTIDRINALITRVRTQLTDEVRAKIITIITIDVHERDVVEKFVLKKITDSQSFAWQSQLKFIFKVDEFAGKDAEKRMRIRITDWATEYSYEYVGNCGRLVITPLTDRCYITLTQALNLTMGGAPAGPAGTGKTETTKDLGRAVGLPVLVFNCSEQMNYQSMSQIYMGLSQTGSWGCFDEFNRIRIEVLSVVSTQVKTILDALKKMKSNPTLPKKFDFMEENINLVSTVGFFITMNPGYAGRTELPENLKALFRSCAMIVPDLVPICENMLMSEGFQNARELSRKFVALYFLCRELLSKQIHYDWGLRAVKSVLRQAGKLKREDPDISEDPILMRALRDFNIPKIVTDDKPIFLRLIDDLFPELICDRKVDETLESAVIKVTKKAHLQAEEGFVLKCVQLCEILEVRHCCFIIGPPGASKTTVWKMLGEAHTYLGEETICETISPKAVTSNELYGFLTKTKEWKDGVLSNVLRDMTKNNHPYKPNHLHKWIILDGDVDPEWIESLNTVMDDNKMLTLVSNERIALLDTMRLLFEIANLRNATPATVSRGGVLFINEQDVGWKPYMETWMEQFKNKYQDEHAHSVFYLSFNQYLSETILEDIHSKTPIVPFVDLSYITTICCILESMYIDLFERKETADYMKNLKTENKEDEIKQIYDAFFIFAMMWAVGGGFTDDRSSFGSTMKSLSKNKFPDTGNCYDYFWDPMSISWKAWNDEIIKYAPQYDTLFQNIVVPTLDTTRLKYILELHMKMEKPVIFVGGAGTGKTAIVKDYFSSLESEKFLTCNINFNSFTDSLSLQKVMEGPVDKRSGKTYGPPTNMKLIYFMDDLNMPFVDTYGTQSPIALIRQLIDYHSCFDREHVEDKKYLVDILYLACMNTKSGSFVVDPRLQRHYTVLSCLTPESAVLFTIFNQILDSHLSKFDASISQLTNKIVSSSIEIFNKIVANPQFMPQAKKFHYQFNLRDLSKVIQGLMLAQPNLYRNAPPRFIKLLLHENNRVYGDRLIFPEDMEELDKYIMTSLKAFEVDHDEVFKQPVIFTSFVTIFHGNEKAYLPIQEYDELKECLNHKLEEYNESNATMNLVLFAVAMEHVCRIARIIDQPAGNALLIGVGGSGKQSLSRLASFLLEYDVMQIMVSTNYGMEALKGDLQTLYQKAAVRPGTPFVFLLTDTQIQSESFLIYINDILSSGYIPELFAKEDLDGIYSSLRNEAKNEGCSDDDIPEYFLNKARKNIHVILCFSPVGEAFKYRVRKFPGIINSTTINWFHEWPKSALIDVSSRFLRDVELPSEEIRENIALNMAEVHTSIDEANKRYLQMERRYNYTTPKSFLELIEFYKNLLGKKRDKVNDSIRRLETGLSTLRSTKDQVEGLQEKLTIKMVDVEKSQKETNVLIDIVETNSKKAEEEQAYAKIEEDKTLVLAGEAGKIKEEADVELAKAYPALERAKEAVNCLEPKAVQEMKALAHPPPEVVKCAQAIFALKCMKGKYDWPLGQKMMGNPKRFIEELKAFDATSIDEKILDDIKPILEMSTFNFEDMKKYNQAAAIMCRWVVNIVEFNTVYKKVKPLQDALEEANSKLHEAQVALEAVQQKVQEANDKVADLNAKLSEAEQAKEKIEAEAATLLQQLELAKKLVGGLGDENQRWGQNVEIFEKNRETLVGDALISSAFVSYIGAFSSQFRRGLWSDIWLEDIKAKNIPFTEGVDPLSVLSTESDAAKWKNEGLPRDRVSIENAAVVVSCSRWPLMIDPQLQGSKWIRGKEGDELVVIQLTQKNWMKRVENAVSMGNILMIENIQQEIDAVLEPLLARAIIRRGRSLFMKLGGEEISYDATFKLYIQTKLSNPHYRPEVAAQCTLINFIVTESGLEDQLLAMVVEVEKPELEATKKELVRKQNEFQVTLAQLEDELLTNLSEADPSTILTNKELIDGLDKTKKTAIDIKEQQIEAQETEGQINILREVYRRVAGEGAMLYFLIINLCIVDHMYQYSLESFITFFFKAIDRTESFNDEERRVLALREQIRYTIYQWVARGLFEKHKQIFLTQITFRLMQKAILNEPYIDKEVQFLFKCPLKMESENPLPDWLPDSAWFAVCSLCDIEGFEIFAQNLSKDAPGRFKEWYNELSPEEAKLPLDWKKLEKQPFQKLLVLRCLRPDRLTTSIDTFIKQVLPDGEKFVDLDSGSSFTEILRSSWANSSPTTPIFFILSPGADPVKDVEKLGAMMDPRYEIGRNLHNVALGQGMDTVAMSKLEIGHKEGHWVMLENIHLMPKWLLELEKRLDEYAIESSHMNFRLFLSAEPSQNIPIGILERCIKLTNEPPQGLKANMKRAFSSFSKEEIDDRETKNKSIVFALCFFHSLVIERRKFGPTGWNMQYPFNMGDLRDSALVLNNYLENAPPSGKLPWDDLRYIFGEIMYGGHIVDDWDRRLAKTYLIYIMKDELLDEGDLIPFAEGKNVSFKNPPPLAYEKYHEHIEFNLPSETPIAFGLHPNAEVGFRTAQCNLLMNTLTELQPRDSSSGGGDLGQMKIEKAKEIIGRIDEHIQLEQNKPNIDDINSKIPEEEKGPYQNVFLQESEYMSILISEILRSLNELTLGFKGELSFTDQMDILIDAIFLDRVPSTWAKLAFPSIRGLGSWLDNLKDRLEQISAWKEDPLNIPRVTYLNRLFNPQSFLTAIKQVVSQANKYELNKLYIQTDITKRQIEQIEPVTKEKTFLGAYVTGMFVQGARWDVNNGCIEESLPKKLFSKVPVVFCRALQLQPEGKEDKTFYQCPVYKTELRGATYVFTAQLKTRSPPDKWVLAGVAVILDVEEK
jgi:dynein heavy chain, axonemal